MRVGMEKYRAQYPHADVLLFEPDREDADMFFANIFSYTHRAQLCETAYRNTRERLLAKAHTLGPILARHGLRIDVAKLREPHHPVRAAASDPRTLFLERPSVKSTARALGRTLDALEACLDGLAPGRGRARPHAATA
jgi:hypothetical protein